jgi:CRISPR system Cascade subunit CasB
MSDNKRDNKIDFVALAKRYTELGTGQQADLRRATLQNIAAIPAYYRLLPNIKTDKRWDRVVFFLPHIKHCKSTEKAQSLGQQLAKKISEEPLFHLLRSESPNDLIQLRRLVQQVEPTVDWQPWGERLFFWNATQKRRLLEDYFFHYSAPKKGASL